MKSPIKYEKSSITLDEMTFALWSKDFEIRADKKTSDDSKYHMSRGKQECKNTNESNSKLKNHGKTSTKINNKSINSNVDKKCFYCNKMSHIKKDCYSWIKKTRTLMLAYLKITKIQQTLVMATTTTKFSWHRKSWRLDGSDWILDSSCIHHMTHNKNW